MPAPVHIAVHSKNDIARLIHIQNPNAIIRIHLPAVHAVRISKGKNRRDCLLPGNAAVQPPGIDESKRRSAGAFHQGEITPCDAQIDQSAVKIRRILRIKDPVHGPPVIQQIHPVCPRPDPVPLHAVVVRCRLVVPGFQNIMHPQHGNIALDVAYADDRPQDFLRSNRSILHLIERAVQIHQGKVLRIRSALISAARFEALRQQTVIAALKSRIVKLLCKGKPLFDGLQRILILLDQPRVVAQFLSISRIDDQNEHIFLAVCDQILQGHFSCDHAALIRAGITDLIILDEAVVRNGAQLKRQAGDLSPAGICLKGHRPVIRNHRHTGVKQTDVPLPGVSMKLIHCRAVLHHGHHRKSGFFHLRGDVRTFVRRQGLQQKHRQDKDRDAVHQSEDRITHIPFLLFLCNDARLPASYP